MKTLLLSLVLLFSPLVAQSAPQCVVEAVQAHKDVFKYVTKEEVKNYVRTWCQWDRPHAEAYLASVIEDRIGDAGMVFSQMSNEDQEERRHQELISAIRDAGDPCSRAALSEYCRALRLVR